MVMPVTNCYIRLHMNTLPNQEIEDEEHLAIQYEEFTGPTNNYPM